MLRQGLERVHLRGEFDLVHVFHLAGVDAPRHDLDADHGRDNRRFERSRPFQASIAIEELANIGVGDPRHSRSTRSAVIAQRCCRSARAVSTAAATLGILKVCEACTSALAGA